MKIVTIITLILLLFSHSVFADRPVTNIIHNDYFETNYNTEGTALGLAASQHHFDLSTYDLQFSVGTGEFNGAEALSFGLAKRFNNILLNATIGEENGQTGYGAGFTMRLK